MRAKVIGGILLISVMISGCAVNNVTLNKVPTVNDLTTSETDDTTTEETTTEEKTIEKIPEETAGAVDNDTSTFSVDMKYPTINDDVIDKLIVDSINEFDIMNRDYYLSDASAYVSGNYEILLHTDNMYSVKIDASTYVHGYAHPSNYCYGLTINLDEAKIVMLDEIIPSVEYIIEAISNGNYEVEYGSLSFMTKEEIIQEIKEVFNSDDFDTYKYNFYMDDKYVYVIIDDIIASDYGIIKINK